jgi:hypothetical protein
MVDLTSLQAEDSRQNRSDAVRRGKTTEDRRQRTEAEKELRIADCEFKKQKTKIPVWERLSSRDLAI